MAITVDTILNLSTKKKLVLLGLVIFVISALFLWSVILPKYKILTKKELEYSSLKVELEIQKKVAQDIVAFQAKLDKVKKELMVMKAKLPDKKEIPKLLKTISSLGKESGLQFQLFRPISEISKDFYAEIPISIKVIGNYHNVAIFFDRVSSLSRIVNIKNIRMVPRKENEKLLTVCTAMTYKFIEKPPENKADKKKKKKR